MPRVMFSQELEGKLIELWNGHLRRPPGGTVRRSYAEKEIAIKLNLFAEQLGEEALYTASIVHSKIDNMKTKAKGLYETYTKKTATGMPVGEVDEDSTYDLESAYTAWSNFKIWHTKMGDIPGFGPTKSLSSTAVARSSTGKPHCSQAQTPPTPSTSRMPDGVRLVSVFRGNASPSPVSVEEMSLASGPAKTTGAARTEGGSSNSSSRSSSSSSTSETYQCEEQLSNVTVPSCTNTSSAARGQPGMTSSVTPTRKAVGRPVMSFRSAIGGDDDDDSDEDEARRLDMLLYGTAKSTPTTPDAGRSLSASAVDDAYVPGTHGKRSAAASVDLGDEEVYVEDSTDIATEGQQAGAKKKAKKRNQSTQGLQETGLLMVQAFGETQRDLQRNQQEFTAAIIQQQQEAMHTLVQNQSEQQQRTTQALIQSQMAFQAKLFGDMMSRDKKND